MKKKFLILPVLAALFAACTSDELVVNEKQTQQTEEDGAIAFDAYLTRSVTRAGAVGDMNIDALKADGVGFGVFAYYANGDLYSENAIPDFMYNQQVNWETSAWTYSPIKYWPNEFGSSAISTGVDRVTFFAYAPWVGVEPATGQLTSAYNGTTVPLSTETGITALTRNGKAGDPYVRYVSAFEPDKCVDLLYGVAAEPFGSSVGAGDGANDIVAGKPFINVAKPDVSSKLKFNFKHALAKLKVQVDADVDIIKHDGSDALDTKTRIWVRSISFDGVAQRGYLNLNNGIWYDVIDNTKISHANVTIHDGLRDGAEPLATDTYETPTGLNPKLVQSVEYTATETPDATTKVPTYPDFDTTDPTITGVTAAYQNLFNGENILVIPANEQLKVTIVYDVETADPTLSSYLSDGKTKGSTVENKITKPITINSGTALKLEAGNAYTINLHLGMTSVKFDALVSGWDDPQAADDTWHPGNGTFSITAPDPQTAEEHAPLAVAVKDATDVAVDMTSGYTFTATYSDNNGHSGVDVKTELSPTGTASGFTVNLPALTDFFGRVYTVTATKTATGEKQTVNITQNAPVITMTTPTASGAVVTLAAPTVTPTIAWDWTGTTVVVYDASNSDAVVDPANYTWDAAAHTVTFVADGSYKFKLTKDESSTAVSDAVSVDVP